MAAWTLTGSHGGPHTIDWRRRAGEVVVLVMRLVTTLLRITTHDDCFEHQLQLLLVLHFYHQFVRVRVILNHFGYNNFKCSEPMYTFRLSLGGTGGWPQTLLAWVFFEFFSYMLF